MNTSKSVRAWKKVYKSRFVFEKIGKLVNFFSFFVVAMYFVEKEKNSATEHWRWIRSSHDGLSWKGKIDPNITFCRWARSFSTFTM